MQSIIELIDTERRTHKNKWYVFVTHFFGKSIVIKGFGTWLQVFKINGINHANPMGQTVKQFKQHVINALNYTGV